MLARQQASVNCAGLVEPKLTDINVALGLGAGGLGQDMANVEVRYIGPDNVNFDVSETGWVGTPSSKALHR